MKVEEIILENGAVIELIEDGDELESLGESVGWYFPEDGFAIIF
jgi:hypothetical protein